MVSDTANDHFDKAYAYDHAGRMTEAYSGREARGLAVSTPTPDSPFRQSFTYNAFNQQVRETGRIWQREMSGQTFSFTNNRRLDLMYDAAGQVIADAQGSHVFDAAGHRVLATAGTVGGGDTGHPEMPAEERAVTYDGDGQPAKNTLIARSEILVGVGPQTSISNHTEITYYLRSTALGGYVVGELNNLGQKSKQYIYAGGERLLEHSTASGFNSINWQHRNPLTDSWIAVDPNGFASFRTEVDAHGRETGIEAPIILSNEPLPPPQTRSPSYLEMQGGATIEAEAGMQLYEDVFLNNIFEDGSGPGQGGYDRLRALREFQLSLGVKFALGMSWLDLKNHKNYEPVLDYVAPGLEGFENGRRVNHYRLKPGTQQRGKAGPFEKEAPRNPNTEDLIARAAKMIISQKDCADFLQNLMGKVHEQTGRSPHNPNIRAILRAVQNQGKVIYGDTIKRYYGWEGATVHGSLRTGTAQIELPFPTPFRSFQPQAVHDRMAIEFEDKRAWGDARTLIHEAFHLAGYSDTELMGAAAALAGTEPPDLSALTPNDRSRAASIYWTQELETACPQPR